MNTAQLLRDAADLIDTEGWTQGKYITPDGSRCVLGALVQAAGGGVETANYAIRSDGQRLVNEACSVLIKSVTGSTPSAWNDAPGRTADEVIAALRATADSVEAST